MQTKHLCILIHLWTKGEVGAPLNRFKPSNKIFYWPFQGGTSFVLCLLCICMRLFICALWSPAGKRLTSWLSFVVSNCKFVTSPSVCCVRFSTWLYRFLIFAPLLTFQDHPYVLFSPYYFWYATFLQRIACLGYKRLCIHTRESSPSLHFRFCHKLLKGRNLMIYFLKKFADTCRNFVTCWSGLFSNVWLSYVPFRLIVAEVR